jgi:glyoxalase family protein
MPSRALQLNIQGIHHITAITGSAAGNHAFYTGVLGLRLVKKTVNFDDPGTYHLYFGDATGTPGTILTFFPWEGISRGHPGAGQVSAVAFHIAEESVKFWIDRLEAHGRRVSTIQRFGQTVVRFSDPDGMPLEMTAGSRRPDIRIWESDAVPAEHALRGFHSATAVAQAARDTEALLVGVLGMHKIGTENRRSRYAMSGPSSAGLYYDIVEDPAAPIGTSGAGTVHHIALRAADDAAQLQWRRRIAARGLAVTDVKDRNYFRSIYFREPGGVLFEIATDPPGFTVDETVEALGSSLMLPPWLESRRPEIENRLPLLLAPNQAGGPVSASPAAG